MEISQDSSLFRVVGILSAVVGTAQVSLSLFLAQRLLIFSLLTGCALFILALFCLAYRHLVQIDPENDVLEEHRRFFFLERNRAFLLSSFSGIGIASLTIRGLMPVHLAFFVELRGRSAVVLPGISFSAEQAGLRAQKIAKELRLPLETKTRRIYPL